jgi:hypothetical protein
VLLALTLDNAKNIAVGLVIGLIVLALLVAKFVRSVTAKAIMILVLGALVLGIWTQRQSLSDCANELAARAQAGGLTTTACTFFGVEVNVPGD